MSMKQVRAQFLAVGAIAATLLAAGCGGGGTAQPPAPTQLTGVAATGAPMAGASVSVIDSDTATTNPAAVTAAADGSFTVNVTGLVAPLVIQATGTVDGAAFRALAVVPTFTANAANTANVTPLTNAVAALIAPAGDPAALLIPATLASSGTAQRVANASALIVNTLSTDASIAAVLGTTFNPLTTAFTANGTGVDAVLDKLEVTVSSAGVAITNLAAPLSGDAVQRPVVLTAAQTATPTVVPTLPASAAAGELPTAAEIAALGARFQACLALPVAQRVTLSAGVVTAVSTACNYAASNWRSNGRSWAEEIGQFTFAKELLSGSTVGQGLVVLAVAPDNLSDPREFRHPYCNSASCVVVRFPLRTPSGQSIASDWVLARAGGVWNFVGNQRPYRAFPDARLTRMVNVNPAGATSTNYFRMDRIESTLRLNFDLTVGDTSNVRAVRYTGPGLPAAGVVLYRSQRCGTDDRMIIVNQDGSTRLNTVPNDFQYWTGGSAINFVLDAANLDGTLLAMPTPVRNATTSTNQQFAPAPVGNQATAIPAWSRYRVEIFRFNALSDTPDEIFYVRIGSAAENAALGIAKPWPTLASSFVDAYLRPTGPAAGAVATLAQTMSWAAQAGTYVGSSYLFGQNFATTTNSQGESANYALRTRLDFEPAALGNTSASGIDFASVVSGTSMSSFTATALTNPNPRCTSNTVVPLTTTAGDFREAGMLFRGADRKLYQATWFWDN